MAKLKICYLCDGKSCQDPIYCYKNGSDCRHTTDLDHALNYSSVPTDEELNAYFKHIGFDVYFEKVGSCRL